MRLVRQRFHPPGADTDKCRHSLALKEGKRCEAEWKERGDLSGGRRSRRRPRLSPATQSDTLCEDLVSDARYDW